MAFVQLTLAEKAVNILPRIINITPMIKNATKVWTAVKTGRHAGICCWNHLFSLKKTLKLD